MSLPQIVLFSIPEDQSPMDDEIRARNGFSVEPTQVVLGNGGEQAL